MLAVVIGIVSSVGIPGASEEIALSGDRASLHMNAVDEVVLDAGCAPVAAPDEAATVRELSQERKVAFPARLSGHHADDVAGQAIVVHAHSAKLCGAIVEEFLLAVLAAIGFEDHDFNSHLLRGGDEVLNQFASAWFEQGNVADGRYRFEARVRGDHVGIEVSHRGCLVTKYIRAPWDVERKRGRRSVKSETGFKMGLPQ
jgi:hypothetical protein